MNTVEILKEAGLRITSSRKKIIEILMNSQSALSEIDLEKQLSADCDRTTIYRTLNTLLENHLVHRLVDLDGVNKYVLNTRQEEESHEHAHFKCNHCGTIHCLPEAPTQQISLPEGYSKLDTNFLVIGVCQDCNSMDN
jgi:Fur family ferric uptake transcriptional regulator